MANTRRLSGRSVGALVAIAFAGLTAGWAVGEAHDRRRLMGEDQQEVARIHAHMKPMCVGRFVIDLPSQAETELTMANVDGLSIVTGMESLADFQTRLADREADIRAIPDRSSGDRNLEAVTSIRTANGLSGKIFVHGRVVSEGTQANGLEIERYRYERVAVDALLHGNGVSIDLTANNYEPARADKVAQLVTLLVPNPENRIPSVTGFCLDYAYFKGLLLPDQGERITMRARLTSHPDIEFMLMLAAGTEPDAKGLLARTAESQRRMTFADRARLTTLRAGRRVIGGRVGEEVAERVVESDILVLHSFWWEVNGSVDDVSNPYLSFTMNTGLSGQRPVPASLSDSTAVLLWDRISSSIRVLASGSSPDARGTET
ncbi:T6SS immunity protein Tli4 family protein [Massilia sp. CFBP9026]|uniref:T6SS immunity protein Tli4 family protein n=1 Tax=Massilia sp. CFBP9026 TaxID=3096536 RepID=UPI002A6AF27D|nr:T6SS immunity protein Tli4 family protein [Massilia sp. CFBP9026]MDY0964188.1 T6SS immunity protein Tli4 family protein [Massilia sp. CFBP9026]